MGLSIALLDTSAAVALMQAEHIAHQAVYSTVARRELGLAGHAWFETFSVMTRMPAPNRRSAHETAEALRVNFPRTVFLSAAATEHLITTLPESLSGGAIYDGLVAAAAVEHKLPLISRDLRARATYQMLGATVEFIETPAVDEPQR